MTGAAHGAVEAVWRIESARLIGGLVRLVGDLDTAEELAHDALVCALERWPTDGIPDNPGAWLMTCAKNRGFNALRRRQMARDKQAEIAAERPTATPPPEPGDDVDDVLRLMLIACHEVLSKDARVALTLRLIGGLTTAEIARAFLAGEPAIAQRIVRAKRTLSEAGVPFEVPRGAALAPRLSAVLEVIYLIFNEGYAATSGDDWMRPALCAEAMRLGRILAGRVPDHAEAHGLVALMELTASRTRARTDATGAPILLLDQDRSRWDHLLIGRGIAALRRAQDLAQKRGRALGPYTLQAAIAACHARARRAGDTDWKQIVALYDALVMITGSPVVELNRAVAVSMAFGPEPALELLDELTAAPALQRYHLLFAVRADLLVKLERADEARGDLTRALSLVKNERERALLRQRLAELGVAPRASD